MPVSETHKTIFIHIPKTGGTSIEFALGMHGNIPDIGIKPYLNQQKDYTTLFGNGLQHLSCTQVFRLISRRLCLKNGDRNRIIGHISSLRSYIPIKTKRDLTGEILKEYYVFTIVRNPYDRLVSQIAWSENKWADGKILDAGLFHKIVNRTFARQAKRIPERLKPQYAYILIRGENYLHDVFHYEDFREDLFQVCQGVNWFAIFSQFKV